MDFASLLPPLLPVVLHTAAIYVFLTVALHVYGTRTMGQLSVVDLVIIVLLGSAIETAMVNANTSLLAGLVCATTLLIMNRALTFALKQNRRLRHLVQGNPILLVHFGHFIDEHLRRAGLTREDVLQAIRERGEAGLETVKFAVMEVDGEINVVPM